MFFLCPFDIQQRLWQNFARLCTLLRKESQQIRFEALLAFTVSRTGVFTVINGSGVRSE